MHARRTSTICYIKNWWIDRSFPHSSFHSFIRSFVYSCIPKCLSESALFCAMEPVLWKRQQSGRRCGRSIEQSNKRRPCYPSVEWICIDGRTFACVLPALRIFPFFLPSFCRWGQQPRVSATAVGRETDRQGQRERERERSAGFSYDAWEAATAFSSILTSLFAA